MKTTSMYKKLVVIVFVTVFMIGVLPFTVFAEDAVEDTSPKVVEITIENFPDNKVFNSVKSLILTRMAGLARVRQTMLKVYG